MGARYDTVTLVDACRAIRERRVTPVELVTEAIRSLQEWQPVTNATSQLFASEALRAADALPARPIGPLHGVPVLVKELFDRARPELNPVAETLGPSFPSGHSSTAAVFYGAAAVLLAQLPRAHSELDLNCIQAPRFRLPGPHERG